MTMPAAVAPLLVIEKVTKNFGGVVALNDVSFPVAPRSVAGLIGPNGSGKTTLLNIINGVYAASSGRIVLNGESTESSRPSELVTLGLTRTFQSARVFSTLTAMQNMLVPLLHHGEAERTAATQRAKDLLEFVGLGRFADHVANALSGGQKRLLEFARALVTKPNLILMDEPFAGVHPTIKADLIRCIKQTVQQDGASFLIVSHEVPDLVKMADSMVCLVEGKVAAAGEPKDVVRSHKVVEGYLGQAVE